MTFLLLYFLLKYFFFSMMHLNIIGLKSIEWNEASVQLFQKKISVKIQFSSDLFEISMVSGERNTQLINDLTNVI